MIDGCHDGWMGGIPVCVLSGTSQQEYSSAARAPTRDGALVKERDYISLGLAAPQEQVHSSSPSVEEKMECDNVVLSLGLGPPDKAVTQAEASPSEQPHAQFSDPQLKVKVVSSGGKSQHFWHQDFRVSLNSENNEHMSNWQGDASSHGASSLGKSYTSSIPAWSPVSARFAIPVPKVSTIPAKRPYQETNAERRSTSVQGELVTHSVMPTPAGVYAWSNDPFGTNPSVGGGWQQVHVKFEQAVSTQFHGNGINTAFGHSSRQLSAVQPLASNLKVPHAAATGISMPPPSSASVAASGAPSSSQAVNVPVNPELADHESSRNKAPVVGWPPVRSFRKNTLQAAHMSNRMSSEDLPTKGMGASSSISDALEHISGSNNKNAFFVKAKLDGVRICRKVDLKAYDSYDGLKGALQEMFQGFVSDNAKLDLLNGNNYVVTHEDKDGDCLLVGDVPWHMFLESSVKSLRIMKARDAISIGEKGSAKLKAPDANGKPS